MLGPISGENNIGTDKIFKTLEDDTSHDSTTTHTMSRPPFSLSTQPIKFWHKRIIRQVQQILVGISRISSRFTITTLTALQTLQAARLRATTTTTLSNCCPPLASTLSSARSDCEYLSRFSNPKMMSSKRSLCDYWPIASHYCENTMLLSSCPKHRRQNLKECRASTL